MPTPKQLKLIKLLRENYGIKVSTKTFQEMLLEAGYSEATARADAKVILNTKAVKEGLEDIVKSMTDKRKAAITHITERKLEKSSPRDLAYVGDILTKNIQLLSGGKTGNEDITIKWL